MKKLIETILILAVCLGGMYVFTLQRSEITALHIQIDTLKSKNMRLLESTFVHDTISVYVFRGVIESEGEMNREIKLDNIYK